MEEWIEIVKASSTCFCGYSLTIYGPPYKKHLLGFEILPFELGPLWELLFFCSPSESFPREYFFFPKSSEKTKSVSLSAITITPITSMTFLRCSSCYAHDFRSSRKLNSLSFLDMSYMSSISTKNYIM